MDRCPMKGRRLVCQHEERPAHPVRLGDTLGSVEPPEHRMPASTSKPLELCLILDSDYRLMQHLQFLYGIIEAFHLQAHISVWRISL